MRPKSIITEMKNSLSGHNSKFDLVEESVNLMIEKQRLCKPKSREKKRMKKNDRATEHCGTPLSAQTCVQGVLEEEREMSIKNIQIMAETCQIY